jgi:hypothetical protein
VLFGRDDLDDAIQRVLTEPRKAQPRKWAMANTGYLNATGKLNEQLRELAEARGLPWTRDIAAKRAAPNLRYAEPGLYRRFDSEYRALMEFMLPPR